MCHLPSNSVAICTRYGMYSAVVLAPLGFCCSFKYLCLNEVGIGVPGVCCTIGRVVFSCSSLKLFFCVQVPSAAITTPAELGSAPAPLQMQKAELVWFSTPRDAAFGHSAAGLLLDERLCPPGGCAELCQASLDLNTGSKCGSGTAWNTELCKSNLGGCGRLPFFLDYSKCGALLAFPCFCLQTREEAAGEQQAAPVGNANGKLALSNASYLLFKLRTRCLSRIPFSQYLSLEYCQYHLCFCLFCWIGLSQGAKLLPI